jgi:peptidoglycan/xylan/chitin deacetylase (PgdA/CDA1 family)
MIKSRLKFLIIFLMSFFLALCFVFAGQNTFEQTSAAAEESVYLPIIMYHSLLKDTSLQNDYTISPDLFESDLKYLADNGYTTVTISDIESYVYHNTPLPSKCIMLTFDDGYYNNYYYAYPLLKKYNSKAVISPIVSMTEKFTQTEDISATYGHISVSDIKEMVQSGLVEIQNHSYDLHRLSPRTGAEQKDGESLADYTAFISEDLTKAQNYLTENAGVTPTCFVYPFGAKSESTPSLIKNLGFICTLTCTEEPNYITHDPESLFELGRYRRDSKEDMQALLKRIAG